MPIGLAAGYLGRTVDLVAMQFINLFIALPGLVLALTSAWWLVLVGALAVGGAGDGALCG